MSAKTALQLWAIVDVASKQVVSFVWKKKIKQSWIESTVVFFIQFITFVAQRVRSDFPQIKKEKCLQQLRLTISSWNEKHKLEKSFELEDWSDDRTKKLCFKLFFCEKVRIYVEFQSFHQLFFRDKVSLCCLCRLSKCHTSFSQKECCHNFFSWNQRIFFFWNIS